jgi:ATP-dependent Lon protease
VLPVGGIKEKVLAARAAGITRIFLPDRNEADVAEIRQEDVLTSVKFIYADHVSTVLDQVLKNGKKPRGKAARAAASKEEKADACARVKPGAKES